MLDFLPIICFAGELLLQRRSSGLISFLFIVDLFSVITDAPSKAMLSSAAGKSLTSWSAILVSARLDSGIDILLEKTRRGQKT